MPRSTGLARIVVDAAIKLQRYAATGYNAEYASVVVERTPGAAGASAGAAGQEAHLTLTTHRETVLLNVGRVALTCTNVGYVQD